MAVLCGYYHHQLSERLALQVCAEVVAEPVTHRKRIFVVELFEKLFEKYMLLEAFPVYTFAAITAAVMSVY